MKTFLRQEYWKGIRAAYDRKAVRIQRCVRIFLAKNELIRRATERVRGRMAAALSVFALQRASPVALRRRKAFITAAARVKFRHLFLVFNAIKSFADGTANLKAAVRR